MLRIILAIKTFFNVLFHKNFSEKVKNIISDKNQDKKRTRNDAVTLLSVLQREARFIDFINEDVSGYTDEQIGAAVRNIHSSCNKSLKRMFDIKPLLDQEENTDVTVPEKYNPEMYNLTGNVGNSLSGKLCHFGWKVTKSELPTWNGSSESIDIISPAEVEIK